jgi:tRNA (cmo5U34)-methyltransferase
VTQPASESVFSGVLGRDYDLLKLICPLAAEMSRLVGAALAELSGRGAPLQVLEIGGGTGITTLAMLTARADMHIVSVDSAATTQDQAKERLAQWVAEGRLSFVLEDALQALREAGFDHVALSQRQQVNALLSAVKSR